jgi:hypothetical protein
MKVSLPHVCLVHHLLKALIVSRNESIVYLLIYSDILRKNSVFYLIMNKNVFDYLDIRILRIATFIRSPKISWTVTVRFSVTVGIGNGFQFFISIWPKMYEG